MKCLVTLFNCGVSNGVQCYSIYEPEIIAQIVKLLKKQMQFSLSDQMRMKNVVKKNIRLTMKF